MSADLKEQAHLTATKITQQVTSDPRWNLQNELMCQVFGFTMYGYVFGIGRLNYFLDIEDIHYLVVSQLAAIGVGRKYAEGLARAAHEEFITENNNSWQNQLNGVGHSYALQKNSEKLVDSIFTNTETIKKALVHA